MTEAPKVAPPAAPPAAAEQPAPYVRHNPVRYYQSEFDPNDIKPEHYAQFGKDEAFQVRKKPVFQTYEDLKGEDADSFQSVKWAYKRDEHEQGFGPGMDDLARIILDNKSTVKFNKKLTTRSGALYWVNEKNKNKPAAKHWSVVVYDLNQDGVPEVLVLDARKDIRYINGFHVGKKNMRVVAAHQKYIDEKYGNPSDIAELRRKGQIAPGELGIHYWMENEATQLDPENPLGPLKIVSPDLAAAEYKTRPMNPCNMFLKFVTQKPYNEVCAALEEKYPNQPGFCKAVRKLASLIPINAELYNHYVAHPVYNGLKKEGYTEKQMRKKYPGKLQSKFSEQCAKEVWACSASDTTIKHVKAYITRRFNDALGLVSSSVGSLERKKHVDLRAPVQGLNKAILDRWFDTPASH